MKTPIIAPIKISICATKSRWRGTRTTASAQPTESAKSAAIQNEIPCPSPTWKLATKGERNQGADSSG